MKGIGELIKAYRLSHGITLSGLAKAVGVSAVYISDIENGKRSPTKEDTLAALSKATKIPVRELRKAALADRFRPRAGESDDSRTQERLKLARFLIERDISDEEINNIYEIIGRGD